MTMTPGWAPVWTAARAAVRRRRLQTSVIGLVVALSSAMLVLALGLIAAASGPFDQAFDRQHGAHLTAEYDAAAVTAADLARQAAPATATAVAGPFPEAVVQASFHDSETAPVLAPRSLTVVGRTDPGGPVDDLTLLDGRWPVRAGEVVVYRTPAGSGPAPPFVDQVLVAGGPVLTVVGHATSMTGTADAWVTPDQLAALHPTAFQMLYRFRSAGTAGDLDAAKAALTARVRPGALLGTQSYLTIRAAVAAQPGMFVPFLLVFGILGLAVAVLIVGNVVSGAVVAGFRHIGVLKALGFTPRQVTAVYLLMASAPAVVGTLAGTTAGALATGPLLDLVYRELFGAHLGVPFWAEAGTLAGMPAVVALAALLPALRARRLPAAEAIGAGVRPHPGRALRVQRRLAGTRLPRPVSLGLGLPLARPGRSLLTLSAVVLGVLSVTFATGLATSISTYQDAENRAGAYQVQIFAAPNIRNAGGARLTDAADEAMLHALPGAAHLAAGATVRAPMLGSAETVNVQFYRGDIPDAGYQTLSGHWPGRPGEVAVSTKFLLRRGLAVGDTVVLEPGGHPVPVRIVGTVLINGGDAMFAAWSALPGFAPPGTRADSYEIQLEPGTDAHAFMAAAVARDPGLSDYALNTVDSLQLGIDGITATLTLALAVIAALGVFNTVVLTTRERRRNLGMLKAIGMTPRQVTLMMVTAMAALGAVGGLLGVPAGILLHRLVMPAVAHAGQITVPEVMLHVYHPPLLALLALAGVAIAAAGALLPAWRAARVTIAEVLQTE